MRRLSLFFAGLLATLPLFAQERPIITGNADFDAATGVTTVTGEATLTLGTAKMTADKITLARKTNVVVASGHVVFTDGPRRLLADTLSYDLNSGQFTAERVRLGEYPLYIGGRSASGTKSAATVEDAMIVLREPNIFSPTLRASKITYSSGQIVQAESAHIGVGPALPISLPKFTQKLNDPGLSYITADAGYRGSLGAFATGGLHIPIGESLRLGGDLGIYTARGLMIGPSGSYASATDPDSLKGSFNSGFINDHGDRKNDILGRPIESERSYAEWTHQQKLTDNLSLTAELNYWKDSYIIRDFRPNDYFKVQEPDTFLESVYQSPNYFVSLFARFQPNRYYTVQERLPEVRFDLLPYALGQGFYQRFNASAAVLREDPPVSGATLRSDRLDAFYALSRPIALSNWGSFTPVAGGRVTYYSNTEGAVKTGDYTRTLGEVGFDAEMRTSATFNYKNDRWKIDGLRHLLTPYLSYRYYPEADQGTGHIPQIDRDVFYSSYLPPLDLGDQRDIDTLHATNTLRAGVKNTLQTRDPQYGSRDLVTLDVATDFRFRREPGQRDVSEVHAELGVMPARWLQFDLYQSFAPQTMTLRELNTGVMIRDGRAWWLRFNNNFLQHDSEQYGAEGAYRLTESYELMARLQYDARERRFVEQSYGVRQTLANQWNIEYSVTLYDGPRRESKFGFRVQVDLLKF
jgi:LPS-assembly protein